MEPLRIKVLYFVAIFITLFHHGIRTRNQGDLNEKERSD